MSEYHLEYPTTIVNGSILSPFSMSVVGPTMSGKTTFVVELLSERARVFSEVPEKVIWLYGTTAVHIEKMKRNFPRGFIDFYHNIPNDFEETLAKSCKDYITLVVLDDLQEEVTNSLQMLKLFTMTCHHKNVSVIFLMQDIFNTGRYRKTLLRNSQYMAVFDTQLDATLKQHLAAKLLPRRNDIFYQIYENATNRKFGYLFISGHPHGDSVLRFRTNITHNTQTVFCVHGLLPTAAPPPSPALLPPPPSPPPTK